MFTDAQIKEMVTNGLTEELIPADVIDHARRDAELIVVGLTPAKLRRMAVNKISTGRLLKDQLELYINGKL